MRVALAILAGAVATAAGIGVGDGLPVQPSTLEGPLTVNGAVTMTTGPMDVDGGMSARTMTTGALTVAGAVSMSDVTAAYVDAGVVRAGNVSARQVSADGGEFGTLAAGPAFLGPPVTIEGPAQINGACAFAQPPSGLVRKGVLTRGTSLGLSVGCVSIGNVSISGVTLESGCSVTYRPTAISFGGVFDCYATSPGIVTVRSCAILALLTAPIGNYGVTLVGE